MRSAGTGLTSDRVTLKGTLNRAASATLARIGYSDAVALGVICRQGVRLAAVGQGQRFCVVGAGPIGLLVQRLISAEGAGPATVVARTSAKSERAGGAAFVATDDGEAPTG